MKLRDWAITLAILVILGLAYSDRQRADEEAQGQIAALLDEAAGK